MIKLKTLLTEDISEMNNVTKALQTALNNFNTTATTTYGKGNIWLLKSVSEHYSQDTGTIMLQTFNWEIFLTNPKTGATMKNSGVGSTQPVTFGKLQILREGPEKAYGNPIYFKGFKINQSSDINVDTPKMIDICSYNANAATNPSWGDTNTSLANMSTAFKSLASKAFDTYTDRNGNVIKTWDKTPLLKTSEALLIEGKKLIEDLKVVFNDIELQPFNAAGKKAWKGMKMV